MNVRSLITAAILLVAAISSGHAATPDEQIDPATGLIVGEGWEIARAHCGACHSYRLITSQGGDKAFWVGTIRWMQATQNLWAIPAEQEAALIRYLATFYPSEEGGRRPPLPQRLMP